MKLSKLKKCFIGIFCFTLAFGATCSIVNYDQKVEMAEANNDSHTVSFDVQSHGTAPSDQTVEDVGYVQKPSNPTAEGYAFCGWYKEAACSNEWDFQSDPVLSDITLYAKWIDYSITTHAIGGYTKDGDEKLPFAALGAEITSSKLDELLNHIDETSGGMGCYGIYVYIDDPTENPRDEGKCMPIDDLIECEGRCYIMYIDDEAFDTTYYGKGYFTIEGTTYFSSLVDATSDENGQEYTY